MKEISDLFMRIAELERRLDSMLRHGKVTDVDTKKQMARLEVGEDADGKPVKSPWVPYGQMAGALKVHTPPTKGQNMTMFAPNAEHRQAMLMPMTWNNDNKTPSDKPDENVITYDNVKITLKNDHLSAVIGGASITVAGGVVTIRASQIKMEQG